MLTITIIFAVLVAAWGFSGAIATSARRAVEHAASRRGAVRARPSAGPLRGGRSVSAAGR